MKQNEDKLLRWREITRETLKEINPIELFEVYNGKFLVVLEKELSTNVAKELKLDSIGYGFIYTFNHKSKIIPINIFDATVILAYSGLRIYDQEVEAKRLIGLKDLQFKYKAHGFIYKIEYK